MGDIVMEELSPREMRDRLRNSIKLKLSVQEVEELAAMLRKHKSASRPKEINVMLRKSGQDRYIYSVKRIADEGEAWTLKNDDGIVTTEDSDGNNYFYVWPYKEYALKCKVDEWKDCELFKLSLGHLTKELLPELSKKGVRVVALEVPNNEQVTSASANDFLNNLLFECSQFA